MCNACGNFCCGSDMFGGCGCDHCPEYECWPDDPDDENSDDGDYNEYDEPVQGFICLPCGAGR